MRRAVFALALLLAAAPARADDAAERRARAMFKEATRLYDLADFNGALDLYRQAYGEWPNVKILLNIGTTLRQLGRNAEAVDAFEKYLADPGADAKKRASVESMLAELERKVAKLRIEVNEPGARILVDGSYVGESPGTRVVRVDPGSHAVVAEKSGVPPAVSTVTVKAGDVQLVQLTLAAPTGAGDGADSGTGKESGLGAGSGTETETETRAGTGMATGDIGGGGAPATTVIRRPRREPPRAALLRGDIDGEGRGAVLAVGGSLRLGGRLDFTLAALIGARQGLYTGFTLLLAGGAWKPRLNVGMPLFLSDGTLLGVHGGAGLEWAASRAVGFFVDFGVTYFLSGTDRYEDVAYVPSLGMQLRF